MKQHIQLIRKVYKERRDTMLQALKDNMPENVHWTYPKGGLFLWMTLPEGVDSSKIFTEAVARKSPLSQAAPSTPLAVVRTPCA